MNSTRVGALCKLPAMRKRHAYDQPRLWSKDPSRQLKLKIEVPSVASRLTRPQAEYDPLPSVWEGTDAELLARMLDFYPRRRPKLILDATVNTGRFWEGGNLPVLGFDIEAKHQPTVVADNTRMPLRDGCVDVIVYDPPHIPNQGADKSKDFNTRFGLVLKSSARNGYNFSHLFPPFVREAYRVLEPEGIMLAKIADYIHGHRFQWAHIELIQAATEV